MKSYIVELPFQGTLSVEVKANNQEEAMSLGKEQIGKLSEEQIVEYAQFGNYDVCEK